VDKFINAIAADVKANSSCDDIDYKTVHKRQTSEYARSALLHYNCEGEKKVRLISISIFIILICILHLNICFFVINSFLTFFHLENVRSSMN
jgi:hypothetical protein